MVVMDTAVTISLHSHGSLLAALYLRLGWEVGVVSRTLLTNQINWGYFLDHSPFEPHCNHHPNNFIILPPVSAYDIVDHMMPRDVT